MIEDIEAVCLRTREDLNGQSFRMCDPLEWRRAGAGSLGGELGDWGGSWEEEDKPKALENERKMTSMQGSNILGMKEKETKARFCPEVWG